MNRLHLSALSLILVSTIPTQKALAQAAAPSSPEAALAAAPYTLHVGTSCIGTLHIQGAAGLHEQADMRDVPSGLSFQAGSHDAWLTGSACGENATIQLVAGAAIVSTTMNYDDLKIDWVEGPLSLRQGRGTIHVDKASALLYRGGGPGDLIMGSLSGPATIAISGPGDIHIEKAQSPSIIIGSSGPGDVVIGGGSVDQLAITLSGPGDAIFDGAARIATLRTSASGAIRVHQVVEKEHTHSSASGEIEIAHSSGHSETFTGSTNSSSTNNGTRNTSDDMLLPDGTRINAHRMIKADGTIVDFDALRHAASEATPPVPPTPPGPPEPPEPPTPPETTDSAMHATTIHTHTDSHPKTEASFSVSTDSGSMTSGVIVLVVLGIVLLRRRIIPRLIPLLHAANPALAKRLEPSLLSLMTRVTTPMPQTQLPQLLDLTERLRKLDRRIGAVETCVTSRDFHLHTQFRDLDRNSG